jgi:hypothetical protein
MNIKKKKTYHYTSRLEQHSFITTKISFRDVITELDCTYRRKRINDKCDIEKLGNCIEEFVREETTLNTEINLRDSKNTLICLLQKELLVFQERLCYVE